MNTYTNYRSSVGMMLVNKEKKVWVGERINSADAWQMPQGGIDAHENPQEAVYRELFEETGIKSNEITIIAESENWLTFTWPKDLQQTLWNGFYVGQRLKWFLIELNTPHDVTNLNVSHPEFNAYKWVNVDELLPMIVDFKRDMYRKIINEFAWYFYGR